MIHLHISVFFTRVLPFLVLSFYLSYYFAFCKVKHVARNIAQGKNFSLPIGSKRSVDKHLSIKTVEFARLN